jgi:hypothetical protein
MPYPDVLMVRPGRRGQLKLTEIGRGHNKAVASEYAAMIANFLGVAASEGHEPGLPRKKVAHPSGVDMEW